MKLARAIHHDKSDSFVFETTALADEWAISGGFEFGSWTGDDIAGKAGQAFTTGWLGVGTFGRSTFVAVTEIAEADFETLIDVLAYHFVAKYGAPSVESARPVAFAELQHMADLCEEHDPETMLTVMRELSDDGIKEYFRVVDATETEAETNSGTDSGLVAL